MTLFKMEIHARTRRTRQWSAIESIAFKVGEDIGEIESDQGTLLVNDNNVRSYHIETLSVTFSKLKKKNQYKEVFNKDKVLLVRANTRTKRILYAKIPSWPSSQQGGSLKDSCVENTVNTGDIESATDVFYG